ncbi:MAG: hypothetical protein KF689_09625 [Gemmatimonadaceae bacterium]|nr:hypothetical protein [Gemmatimonadaceae bacterium]MCW5826142.1 hypothetical protein [Gemmatimonadaceae bacterium]
MQANIIGRSALLLAALAIVACGGGDASDASREIELAPADTGAAMNDAPAADAAPAPAAAAPRTPTPRSTPAATTRPSTAASTSAARSGALSAGATIALASGSRICTNTHKVGDRFTALTTADVEATNGVTIPTGSEVTLEVVESARGENSQERVKLAFKPVSITVRGTTTELAADVTQVARLEYARVQSTGTQAGKVATGAAIGAVAGQVLGRDTKSTVAGAAIGAAAGGAVAAATTDYNGCLAANAPLTVTLTEQLTVRGN